MLLYPIYEVWFKHIFNDVICLPRIVGIVAKPKYWVSPLPT